MEYTFWLLGLITLFCFLAYHKSSLTTFTMSIGAWLLLGTLFAGIGQFTWFVFLLFAGVLNVTSIRQQLISEPALRFFKKSMPAMSKTEKEALEAGTTWWEADLLKGEPSWSKLHKIPQPRLTNEEQAFLDGPVEQVCQMVNDWQVTHQDGDLSPQTWQFLKDHKFFSLIIKKKYGGLEFSAYAQSCVLQKLMPSSTVLAVTVGVPNSLGPAELLQQYGTREQKDYYLPRLANGQEIPCFALTSPEAGSDAGAIPDKGIVCKRIIDGEEILGIALTFNKRYITLAPVATLVGLAFKLFDPEQLLGSEKELGITCALIPRDTDGLDIGRRHFPLNVPFQNGPIRGDDVFVPIETIIGGAKMAGQGWRMLVECLSVGRAITLPSNATGGAKSVALATGAYAKIRRQFKLPIGKMEGIEEALGRIGGNAYLMDAACSMSTQAIDLGEKPSVISAIVKYHLTERSRDVANYAMDIHGGKGIMLGPRNYLGRGYQGVPIAITVEGANILTRNMIIFGQGLIRCHPYILQEMACLEIQDEADALNAFDKALTSHLGFVLSNAVRSVWFALSGARFSATLFNDQTKRYYQTINRFSANLALLSDLAMATLGGSLKRNERVSARLGDILSQLYLATAALKRFDDDGRREEDLPLLQWALEDSLYQCQSAMLDLIDNFPVPFIGTWLKIKLFPFGLPVKKPSDLTEQTIAKLLQTPCELRARLGRGLYLDNDDGNLFGELEVALELITAADRIHKKLQASCDHFIPFTQLDELAKDALAKGQINQDEAQTLIEAEAARLATINVDDFSSQAIFTPQHTEGQKI
ncbi:acyl-CoA dehydrogenase [Catenovulum sp. SM1970]|uniref:acyl-CoA dehydrogenase FadE n=1 Tax=Marinifaba aquimaris TaxID=2741323 RepID=UPI001572DE65|nr:acyl-CoA dehydrogenase FadE [Marinifaba aquimaris]NTS77014.1 acyl-CoA dehydrogenase [Marinifaba aquimaris]